MVPNPFPGKLFTVTGPDGVGKSDIVKDVVACLQDEGVSIESGYQPTKGGAFGKIARYLFEKKEAFNARVVAEFLRCQDVQEAKERHTLYSSKLRPLDDFIAWGNELITGDSSHWDDFVQYAMLFDGAWHIEHVVIPQLKNGVSIFLDRYRFDGLAYYAGAKKDWVSFYHQHRVVLGGYFLLPDLAIFLDAPTEHLLGRLQSSRVQVDHFETPERLEANRIACRKVFDAFRSYFPKNFMWIDNPDGAREQVIHDVCDQIWDLTK